MTINPLLIMQPTRSVTPATNEPLYSLNNGSNSTSRTMVDGGGRVDGLDPNNIQFQTTGTPAHLHQYQTEEGPNQPTNKEVSSWGSQSGHASNRSHPEVSLTEPLKHAMDSYDCSRPRKSKRRRTIVVSGSRQPNTAYTLLRSRVEKPKHHCPFPKCLSTFTRLHGVSKHIHSIHEGTFYSCARHVTGCDFVANRQDSVHRHERLVHDLHRMGCRCTRCHKKDRSR